MVEEMLRRIASEGYEVKMTRDVSGNPLSFRVDLYDPRTRCHSMFVFDPDGQVMTRLTDDEMMHILQKLLEMMGYERTKYLEENNA